MATRTLNDREIATLLHGLRMIQEHGSGDQHCMAGLCDHFADAGMLADDEIDLLCEQINLDGVTVPVHPADAPVLADLAAEESDNPTIAKITPEQRARAEKLLSEMQTYQTDLWDASLELEKILGCDIDTTDDLQEATLESLADGSPSDDELDEELADRLMSDYDRNSDRNDDDEEDSDFTKTQECRDGKHEICPDVDANCCDCSCHLRGGSR